MKAPRTCDDLGMCQRRSPPCLGCNPLQEEQAGASRMAMLQAMPQAPGRVERLAIKLYVAAAVLVAGAWLTILWQVAANTVANGRCQ